MAIMKNIFRASRLDGEITPGSRDGGSSEADDDELPSQSLESDGTDVSEVDSGMGSDDYDLSELGEAGCEYCQVGNQSCLIPFDLYDLPDLSPILSVDTWNYCLTEEERFALAQYFPDMDQETFSQTLEELFSGSNFHFGSPVMELFNRLRGGLCEPRVNLYCRCLNFFQRREHYHQLRKYQNAMVDSLVRMRDAWENYTGYGIEERLRLLNILRSQRPSDYLRDGDWGSETDSENGGTATGSWNKRPKMGQQGMRPMSPSVDAVSHTTGSALERTQHWKEYPRGILKVSGKNTSSKCKYTETEGKHSFLKHDLKTKQKPSASPLSLPRQDPAAGFELGSIKTNGSLMRDVDDDSREQLYGMTVQRGTNGVNPGLIKRGKKIGHLKMDFQYASSSEDQEALHHFARSKDSDHLSMAGSFDSLNKGTHAEMNSPETDYLQSSMPKESRIGQLAGRKPRHQHQIQDAVFLVEDDWGIKSKKWKPETGAKINNYNTVHAQVGELVSHSDHKAKASLPKVRGKSSQNGGADVGYRGSGLFAQSEETESESSEQEVKHGDICSLSKKLRWPSSAPDNYQSGTMETVCDSRKIRKHMKKVKKEKRQCLGQDSVQYTDSFATKGKDNSKSRLTNLQGRASESLSASAKASDDQKHNFKWLKKGKVHDKNRDVLEPSLAKGHSAVRKRKGIVGLDYAVPDAKYGQDNANSIQEEEEGDFDESPTSMNGHVQANKSGSRGQVTEILGSKFDPNEKPNRVIFGCNSITKRRKGKAEEMHLDWLEESSCVQSSPKRRNADHIVIKKKANKREDSAPDSSSLTTPDPIMLEKEPEDMEPEPLPSRNHFSLITPTVHTGFSFSIIHLLSAIRKVMITVNAEDATEMVSHPEKNDGRQRLITGENNRTRATHSNEMLEGGKNLPSLTVQEIVNRVGMNPGDPCILETQEPLEDLIRGVLKIFSSKTAPLGAKGWKALVLYEKNTKSWSWIGPVSSSLSDHDAAEEETSSEVWGIPDKMLVKLVDAFANWLISIQETLKQIGSLPPPPVMMLPNMDEKERFKGLRAQKSFVTISPSSDEVREYFRREEFLRYSIPDRAFSYTAIDGRKSIVAPLRRGSGKPTSKARDHFMLKPDRPPHVTILCLVRDAAARLPGSIGTRADVCTLIRDSQYLVEDVSDAQVNSVVSGALDRLHYEQDPCVQFDGERKIWVYLHRDREEEDFEDYGSSSTKKCRRPRRDASEHADMRQATDEGFPEIGDQDAVGPSSGYELRSDPNVDSPPAHMQKKSELISDIGRPSMENIEPLIDSTENNMHQDHPMVWEVLGENRMLCQENSTNEDFDDESYTRERHIGLINASFL